MANLVALMAHTKQGDHVIMEAASHILWSEEWSFATICGVVPRPLEGVQGYIEPEAVRRAIVDKRFSHRPHTSLLCLENTHNMAGGDSSQPRADSRHCRGRCRAWGGNAPGWRAHL